VVDYQRDFCPGGALPVEGGDDIAPIINRYIDIFGDAGSTIVTTRDYHPPDHISFRDQGGIWPPHCVRGTEGAKFHRDLDLPKGTMVVSKAKERDREAYSGFDGTGLAEALGERDVERVYVIGLATDYCVKSTVLDSIKSGFRTAILTDAVRSVDVEPGDGDRALEDMKRAGAELKQLQEILGD
jgi:nicotinamidase-related amidase